MSQLPDVPVTNSIESTDMVLFNRGRQTRQTASSNIGFASAPPASDVPAEDSTIPVIIAGSSFNMSLSQLRQWIGGGTGTYFIDKQGTDYSFTTPPNGEREIWVLLDGATDEVTVSVVSADVGVIYRIFNTSLTDDLTINIQGGVTVANVSDSFSVISASLGDGGYSSGVFRSVGLLDWIAEGDIGGIP